MKISKKKKVILEIEFALMFFLCAIFLVFKSCHKSEFHLFNHDEQEQNQEPATRSTGLTWDYPVKPGMAEWNSLETEKERIAVLQVPENILATLSPEEVVGLCITFPFFGHFTAWGSSRAGFNVMLEKYNILRHKLMASPDRETITEFINSGWLFKKAVPIEEIGRMIDNYINSKSEVL